MKYKVIERKHFEADRIGELVFYYTTHEFNEYIVRLNDLVSVGDITYHTTRKHNVIVVDIYF